MKCPVYLGHSKVSLIQRCPYFKDVLYEPGEVSCIFGTQQGVLNTEVSLFQGCPLRA